MKKLFAFFCYIFSYDLKVSWVFGDNEKARPYMLEILRRGLTKQ